MGGPADLAAVEAEVEHIRTLDIQALRWRWHALWGTLPPEGLTKDIIARMIAYRIQELALGGLDRATAKLLDQLAQGGKTTELHRRMQAGTVLIREYQGRRQTVTITRDGFLWNGETYPSLSVIARKITGTSWNGPRFFGLREKSESKSPAGTAAVGQRFRRQAPRDAGQNISARREALE